MTQNEEDILIAKARDDIREFEPLYEAYFEKIYQYVFHRTSNHAVTEDIVQQTFLKAIENFHSYHSQGYSFGSWLYRIAHNLVVDEYAKKKHLSLDEAVEHGNDQDHLMLDAVDNSIDRQRLTACISELPPHYQDVVELKKQGLKVAHISEILEKTESAVKVTFFRAVKMLRDCLFGSLNS